MENKTTASWDANKAVRTDQSHENLSVQRKKKTIGFQNTYLSRLNNDTFTILYYRLSFINSAWENNLAHRKKKVIRGVQALYFAINVTTCQVILYRVFE